VIPLTVALGAMFGAAAATVIWALTRPSPTAGHHAGVQHRERPWRRFDRLGLRLGTAACAAVGLAVLTGWPVGIALAAAGGFFAPSLLGARARNSQSQARLEGIAAWTEQLRDVMAAAAGLEQAICATAGHAPPAIRADVVWLAGALEAGTTMRVALRRFAQRLDDPAGDLVVAALILAAEGSPRQLGELLGRLAATTRDTVKMQMRIDTGRARTRSSVKVVTSVTVVFSTGIVILNPTYVEAYRSGIGQVVLVAVAACFASAFWWLARSARPSISGRFLASGSATTVGHVLSTQQADRP
jgi:tight adherence protein B